MAPETTLQPDLGPFVVVWVMILGPPFVSSLDLQIPTEIWESEMTASAGYSRSTVFLGEQQPFWFADILYNGQLQKCT